MTTNLSNETREELTTLIEAFWEFEVICGASLEAVIAAINLQSVANYTTDYDVSRAELLARMQKENENKQPHTS